MTREEQARKTRSALIDLSTKDSSLSVNELRIILALERIVARLSSEPLLDKHLIYKGGFVLMKSLGSERFTRDLDALGYGLEKRKLEALVPAAIKKDLDDGFWFGDGKIESLDEQGEYGALRFNFAYQIGDPPLKKDAIKKLSRVHFDIGFGDAIPSKLAKVKMNNLLKSSSEISWKIYPPEFIFSEKLQILVSRKDTNSRSKDIYDLVLLFEICKDTRKLKDAIEKTFTRRDTVVPKSFLIFAEELDLTYLQNAWKGVQISDSEVTFESQWTALKKHLRKLDENLTNT